MNTPALSAGMAPAFDINLLGDRVGQLRRRRAMQQACVVGALLLSAGALVLLAITAGHLMGIFRVRTGVADLSRRLNTQQKICQELNILRETAAVDIQAVEPLVQVARGRVAWAPKLSALAAALSPADGIVSVTVSRGDRPGAADAGPRLQFSIVHSALNASGKMPMDSLERLARSPAFMHKMKSVRFEAVELETWHGQPAFVLRGVAQGATAP